MNESSAGATETVATDAAGAVTPADVHPSLPTRHTLKEFVFQLVTITAGVLIALAIDGVVEWKQNRDLVREATATITREITDNRAALERPLERQTPGRPILTTLWNRERAARRALSYSGNLDPHQAAPADLERFRQHLQALRGALLVDRQLGDSLLRA